MLKLTDFGCTITLPAQKLKQPPPAPTVSEPPFIARQVVVTTFGGEVEGVVSCIFVPLA